MVEHDGQPTLIVLGMHRSGTSAITGALGLCGALIGDAAELTAPNVENPRGFFERRDMRAVCNALLAAGGADWWRVLDFAPQAIAPDLLAAQRATFAEIAGRLGAQGVWAIKEPRLSLLLPLLAPVLARPVCVHIHRSPLEVARSLQARNGFGLAEGMALWEVYTRSALVASADLPRASILYRDLMADPVAALALLLDTLTTLGVEGLATPDPEALRAFVSPGLHRQKSAPQEETDLLSPAQDRLWRALQDGLPAPDAGPDAALAPATRQILRDFETRKSAQDAVAADLRRRTAELERLSEAAGHERARNAELHTALLEARAQGAARAAALKTAHAEAQTAAERLAVAEAQAHAEREAAAHSLAEARTEEMRVSRQLIASQYALKDARRETALLRKTTSWRITAPVRAVGDALKRVRRGAGPLIPANAASGLGGGRLSKAIGLDKAYARLQRARTERLVRRSDLFDADWYLAQYPDVAKAGVDPLRHFLAKARREGRNPSAGFDTLAYLRGNDDAARSKLNPLVHYLTSGRRAGALVTPVVPDPAQQAEVDTNFDPERARAWTMALRADPAAQGLAQAGPLVSVILPTHNRAQLVGTAIESVRAQGYPRWELIVVDDGSTDGTSEMIRATWDDPRIRILRTEGLGVSGARNAGLAQATGALVAYLDSDNFWMPDYLELMTAELARSGADCVYAVLKVRGQDGKDGPEIWHRATPFDFERLKHSNFIDLNIFMHRKALFEAHGGFDTALRRAVDWDLILRYVRHAPVSFAYFVGAEYDHSDRADRLTVKELFAFKNVVRNKHWIDWEAMAARLPERKADLVSVILSVQSPIRQVEARLRALFTHPAGAPFELILVDGGSDLGARAILEAWRARESAIRIVDTRENVHLALGSNMGFAASCGATVVFLSDRVEVSPEWLRSLVRPLREPAVHGVQAKILDETGAIASIGWVFDDAGPAPRALHAGQPGDFPATNRPRALCAISGACAAFRAEDIVAARGFFPIFSAEMQDADLCLRIGGGAPVFRMAPDAVVMQHPNPVHIRATRVAADHRQFAEIWAGGTPADVAAGDDTVGNTDTGMPPAPARPRGPAAAGLGGRTVAIKIGCPRPEMKDHWGDYHFAAALAAAFLRRGLSARIDFATEPDRHARHDDVNLVLRGRQKFAAKPGAVNLMWMISHPERPTAEELRSFDHVFIASEVWTREVEQIHGVSCQTLLQCTDSSRFYPELSDPALRSPALFVANSRKVLRSVVREAMEQDLPIDIWGEMWEGLAPPEWIKGEKIENVDLPRYYASAEVVLNDHWDSMRENGFVSNRIFDVLACAAPLVTDLIVGLPPEIADRCHFFGNGVTLSDAVATARQNGQENRAAALATAAVVRARHSFDARAEEITAVLRRRLAGDRADGRLAS